MVPLSDHDGPTNMAIDEAIVAAVASGSVPATLRFYAWSRPTLSLGYFQNAADAGNEFGGAVDIVRRSTGGGAIMHHHELTYSLSLPLADAGPGAREGVYRSVHRCVIETLEARGITSASFRDTVAPLRVKAPAVCLLPTINDADGLRPAGRTPDESFLCFQRRTDEDLICGGYKILGSAQRRVRGGVLQHGSLLLRTSSHADVLPGIFELADVDLDVRDLTTALAERIGEAMSITWHCGELSDAELATSHTIRADRYAAAEWTRRR